MAMCHSYWQLVPHVTLPCWDLLQPVGTRQQPDALPDHTAVIVGPGNLKLNPLLPEHNAAAAALGCETALVLPSPPVILQLQGHSPLPWPRAAACRLPVVPCSTSDQQRVTLPVQGPCGCI